MTTGSLGSGLPRWVEIPLAFFGLVVFSPLLLVTMLAVRLSSPGPVIFRQQRVGKHGKHFTLYKFRTMRVNNEGSKVTAGGDPRITPIGRVLRKAKLDELPELWNILRGDMSFVGPRPEVPELVELDNPLWEEILCARPGITDPVTLSLRNEEELLAAFDGNSEHFYQDVLQPYKLHGYQRYLRSRTIWIDLTVIGKTVLAVIVPSLVPVPSLEDIRRG